MIGRKKTASLSGGRGDTLVQYMLVLMLPFIKLRRAPYPCTVLLILILTRELCEDGEHA
jgi:hypothetical protein